MKGPLGEMIGKVYVWGGSKSISLMAYSGESVVLRRAALAGTRKGGHPRRGAALPHTSWSIDGAETRVRSEAISAIQATLGDEEASDIKSKPGPDGQVLAEPVLWFRVYLSCSEMSIAGLARAFLLAATRNRYYGER